MQIKSLVTCILSVVCCYANTEKTIFLAPNSVEIPKLHPNLDSLQLSTITSSNRELRTRIRRKFATSTAQKGLESWYILDYLTPGQRYELRVCWVATEPTEFWLYTWTMQEVFNTPELITSLADYSERLISPNDSSEVQHQTQPQSGRNSSLLFLQVYAAADYFTLNQTLMVFPPPVLVDLILDPYTYNVFPKSLLSIAAYIVTLAVGSLYLSSFIWNWLQECMRLKLHVE